MNVVLLWSDGIYLRYVKIRMRDTTVLCGLIKEQKTYKRFLFKKIELPVPKLTAASECTIVPPVEMLQNSTIKLIVKILVTCMPSLAFYEIPTSMAIN